MTKHRHGTGKAVQEHQAAQGGHEKIEGVHKLNKETMTASMTGGERKLGRTAEGGEVESPSQERSDKGAAARRSGEGPTAKKAKGSTR